MRNILIKAVFLSGFVHSLSAFAEIKNASCQCEEVSIHDPFMGGGRGPIRVTIKVLGRAFFQYNNEANSSSQDSELNHQYYERYFSGVDACHKQFGKYGQVTQGSCVDE